MKSQIVWLEQSVGYHFHAQLNTKSSFFSDRWIFDSFRFGQVSRIHSTGLKKMNVNPKPKMCNLTFYLCRPVNQPARPVSLTGLFCL